jgi:tetratricopeptide (TPR) repeat protein
LLSLAYAYRGDANQAGIWAQRIRTIAERFSQMEFHEGHAEDALCLSCVVDGRYDDAVVHAQRAINAYERIEAYDPIAYVLNVWGLALMGLGQRDKALARFAEAIDTARQHTVPRAEGIAALNQARAIWQQGDRQAAQAAAGIAADVLASIGSSEAAAAKAFEEALASADDPPSRRYLASLLSCAQAVTGNGDLFPPVDLATTVRDAAKQFGMQDMREKAEAILRKVSAD